MFNVLTPIMIAYDTTMVLSHFNSLNRDVNFGLPVYVRWFRVIIIIIKSKVIFTFSMAKKPYSKDFSKISVGSVEMP